MTAFRKRCLLQEGFGRFDDTELARLDWPLRFSPALCMGLTVVALVTRNAYLFAGLALVASVAAGTRRHPFDLLWDVLVRPVVGGPRLPKAPCPRRFAFVMAAPVLAGAALAFAVGAGALGFVLGGLQFAGCAAYVLTGWCGASVVYRATVRRPAPLPAAGT